MGLDLEYIDGQTPLDEEEKEGLLIPTIASRGELDEFEQQNIEQALQWTLGRNFRPDQAFTEAFVKMIHKRMYGEVWSWAGQFRKSNKNLGIDWWQVPTSLHALQEELRYWHEHATYTPEEIAIRFKHRIVSIHCFPNGNGRHSRLMADIIIENIYKQPVFTWGSGNLSADGAARKEYLDAIRLADNADYGPLIAFARS